MRNPFRHRWVVYPLNKATGKEVPGYRHYYILQDSARAKAARMNDWSYIVTLGAPGSRWIVEKLP